MLLAMTSTEKQLYDLLIEIKEDQAELAALFKSDKWLHEEQARRMVDLERQVAANTKQVTALSASIKAWYAASAAVGGIIGWLLSYLPGGWDKS